MNVSEECLFFDVFSVALAGSQASLWILSQQLEMESKIQQLTISHLKKRNDTILKFATFSYPPHDGDGFQREESRITNFIVDDTVKDFLFIVARERRLADQHFKDEDAEAPPVDGSGVRRFRQHLGRQEFGRSTECSRPVSKTHSFFAKSEIGDFHVAFGVQQ